MQNVPSVRHGQCPWCVLGDELYVLVGRSVKAICSKQCGYESFQAVEAEDRLKLLQRLWAMDKEAKRMNKKFGTNVTVTV